MTDHLGECPNCLQPLRDELQIEADILAGKALEVMLRRHWCPFWSTTEKKWQAGFPEGVHQDFRPIYHDNPFAVLLLVDEWHKERGA